MIPLLLFSQETAVPVKERWHVYLVPHKDKFTFYKNNDIKYVGDPLTLVQMRDLSLTFIRAEQVVEFDSLTQEFSLSELKNQLHAEDKIVLGDVQTQILKMLGKELQ